MRVAAANHPQLPVLNGWRGLSIVMVLAAHLLPLGPKAWKLNYSAGIFGMIKTVFAAALLTLSAHAHSAALPTDAVFARDSFWYTPIPRHVELHPETDTFVQEFLRQKKAYYGNVNLNTSQYASPVYVVGPNVKGTDVSEWDCQNKKFKDKQLAEQWKSVPIPDYAEPADGSDAEMTIYQPSSDTVWEFWRARRSDGSWEACWGGRLDHDDGKRGRSR